MSDLKTQKEPQTNICKVSRIYSLQCSVYTTARLWHINENEYGANGRKVTDRKAEVLEDILTGKLKCSKIS
jgi:hypothetical protein